MSTTKLFEVLQTCDRCVWIICFNSAIFSGAKDISGSSRTLIQCNFLSACYRNALKCQKMTATKFFEICGKLPAHASGEVCLLPEKCHASCQILHKNCVFVRFITCQSYIYTGESGRNTPECLEHIINTFLWFKYDLKMGETVSKSAAYESAAALFSASEHHQIGNIYATICGQDDQKRGFQSQSLKVSLNLHCLIIGKVSWLNIKLVFVHQWSHECVQGVISGQIRTLKLQCHKHCTKKGLTRS